MMVNIFFFKDDRRENEGGHIKKRGKGTPKKPTGLVRKWGDVMRYKKFLNNLKLHCLIIM